MEPISSAARRLIREHGKGAAEAAVAQAMEATVWNDYATVEYWVDVTIEVLKMQRTHCIVH
jgi:hypothetical protein